MDKAQTVRFVPPGMVTELTFRFSRASGPGGQNVNKVATKAEAVFRVGSSRFLSDEEKTRVRLWCTQHKRKVYSEESDELRVTSQRFRTQAQNREVVELEFLRIMGIALNPPNERKKTKVPRRERNTRLLHKQIRGKRKQLRRGVSEE